MSQTHLIVEILDKRGFTSEACKLALVSKSVMIEVGKQHFFLPNDTRAQKRPVHPLQALENTMQQPWKRLCVSYAILNQGHTFLPQIMSSAHSQEKVMRNFIALYREELKGKLSFAREAHPEAPYTFHFVYRFTPNPSEKKSPFQKALKGGEVAVHRFICMPNMVGALAFFQRWSVAQMGAEGKQATCLMECGPSDSDKTCRKWIIDVDGAYQDLKSFGFLQDPSICSEQVRDRAYRWPMHAYH
jgi:hypothetical protein